MKKLSYIILPVVLCITLSACTEGHQASDGSEETDDTALREATDVGGALLPQSADMGTEYIDSFIFIGESTTYHMKSRGVLSGGKNTQQVWAPKNGTMTLDATVCSVRIVYPETGAEMTIAEAMRLKRPERAVLTFGLNGAIEKIKRGEEYFRSCYLALINSIRSSSPDTRIIIQACFPIAEDMDTSNYSVDAQTLSGYIATINLWALRLANDEGIGYLNTYEALAEPSGFLRSELDVGDGYHLTAAAYEIILEYIRTHADTNGD